MGLLTESPAEWGDGLREGARGVCRGLPPNDGSVGVEDISG
jgi:hypothetical protein